MRRQTEETPSLSCEGRVARTKQAKRIAAAATSIHNAVVTTELSTGYHLTHHIAGLCRELAGNVPALSHIDPARVLYGLARSRAQGRGGVYAACQPLRFEGGERIRRSRGREWEWPALRVGGVEVLYYLIFYVPRFLDLPPDEKLKTIVHELYHISPAFDGDLRRLGEGRHAHHGSSTRFYERLITPVIEEARVKVELTRYAFVNLNYAELVERHGRIVGQRARNLRPRELRAVAL